MIIEKGRYDVAVALTGQHKTMLDQMIQGFELPVDYNLDIFSPGQSPAAIAAKTLLRLDPLLETEPPAAVMVQGDTTSALAAGLAAFYHRVPVIHVEAGLRTDNLFNPFPEEANRRALSQIGSLHLAPTANAKANVLADGIDPTKINVTGNTVIDALALALQTDLPIQEPTVARLLASDQRLILVTSHRRESWGEPMRRIAQGLAHLATDEPDTQFVLPLHANPTVREAFQVLAGLPNVALLEPLGYFDLAKVIAAATLVITDSGGIQEEAPSLGKPVLVLRDNTERPEGVASGTARLVGTDPQVIYTQARRLLDDPIAYDAMAQAVNPYGDGLAAQRSEAAIAHFLELGAPLPEFDPGTPLAAPGSRTVPGR